MARCWLLLAAVVAGCATTPEDDPLVWSDDVVRSLETQHGEEVAVARFSRLAPGAGLAPWQPWVIVRGNTPTRYSLAKVDGETALEAEGVEGGSGVWRRIRVDPQHNPILEWRWR